LHSARKRLVRMMDGGGLATERLTMYRRRGRAVLL
jgi:hypothetical protein